MEDRTRDLKNLARIEIAAALASNPNIFSEDRMDQYNKQIMNGEREFANTYIDGTVITITTITENILHKLRLDQE